MMLNLTLTDPHSASQVGLEPAKSQPTACTLLLSPFESIQYSRCMAYSPSKFQSSVSRHWWSPSTCIWDIKSNHNNCEVSHAQKTIVDPNEVMPMLMWDENVNFSSTLPESWLWSVPTVAGLSKLHLCSSFHIRKLCPKCLNMSV